MTHETLLLLPNGQYDPMGCEHRNVSYQPNCDRRGEIQVRGAWLCRYHHERLDDAVEWRRLTTATRLEAWER